MAIRAPWTGRVGRVGMPVVSGLIVANTLTIFVLSIFNAAAVELDGETNNVIKDRALLGIFWCATPLLLGIATISETFCLWTDRLAPIWVLVSSSVAICIWAGQIVLWQLCVSGAESTTTPGYCPHIYHAYNPVPFFTWYKASVSAPVAATPSLIFMYTIQLAFAALVVHRQRRYAFRQSDLVQTWERKSFDESEVTLVAQNLSRPRRVSVAEQERMLYHLPSPSPSPSPPQSMRSAVSFTTLTPQRKSSSSWHSFSQFSGTWR